MSQTLGEPGRQGHMAWATPFLHWRTTVKVRPPCVPVGNPGVGAETCEFDFVPTDRTSKLALLTVLTLTASATYRIASPCIAARAVPRSRQGPIICRHVGMASHGRYTALARPHRLFGAAGSIDCSLRGREAGSARLWLVAGLDRHLAIVGLSTACQHGAEYLWPEVLTVHPPRGTCALVPLSLMLSELPAVCGLCHAWAPGRPPSTRNLVPLLHPRY